MRQRVSVLPPLRNGMRLYAHYDRVAHVSGIGVRCGSLNDPPGMTGMAHALEHLITRRSRKYTPWEVRINSLKYMGKPDDLVDIHTTHSYTFFGHNALLTNKDMLAVFDMMASFVRDRVTEIDDMESEWAAVRQEWGLRGRDDIEDCMDVLVHETMYEKNPARRRIDCIPEELRKITLPDVQRFLRAHYVPKNMYAIVLGPSVEETKKLVRKYFSDWRDTTPAPAPLTDKGDGMPRLSQVKLVEVSRAGIDQHHVAIAFPTETYMSSDAEALDVLAEILENRLYGRLRDDNQQFEKGAYRLWVKTPRTYLHGLFYIHFPTASAEFAKEGADFVLEELARLRTDFVRDDELDAAVGWHRRKYLAAFRDTPGDLSALINTAVSNGDEDLKGFHSFLDNLRRIGKKKIIATANKYLTENYVKTIIFPA